MKNWILFLVLMLLAIPNASAANGSCAFGDCNHLSGDASVTGDQSISGDLSVGAGITTTGNVGIGTSDPVNTLDLRGTFSIYGVDGVTNYWGEYVDFMRDDNYIRVGGNHATQFTLELANGDGNLGTIALGVDGTTAKDNLSLSSSDGMITAMQVFRFASDADTINDNGAGTAASHTLTPSTSGVTLTCNDANGCDITMGETNYQNNVIVTIVNISANACNFTDASGVELAGNFAMGQYDSLTLTYKGATSTLGDGRWIELSRSDN